ncbi:hypothetical protein OG819_55300 [Streptomyces sp. NBC_01549]|uniref:hypothetical protein n=1 Tax=Streptomyces sp. NBC_01549 TaxID=2975874 RepID=UPI00224D6A4C|nr:hypothetical protein [Streptomyces sp. NBC_01549]MCX4598326.1 hypothetical protein [Streptomyces sp. NBC_01549]
MNTEQYLVDQEVGPHTPAVPTAIWQPAPQQYPIVQQAAAPALTLYQVPVPGAIQVQLPDGRIAWGRPVEHSLDPVPAGPPHDPMPGWAKAIGMVAGSLTALALGGAIALRIAAPALGGLVDVLDMLWKVALVLAVILFGAAAVVRSLYAKAAAHVGGDTGSGTDSGQTVIFAPQIDTGGNRIVGRGGDVNIQWGDRNRNKQ